MPNLFQLKARRSKLKANSYKLKASAGTTIIELTIVLGVIMMGILGVFSLMTQSLGLTRVVSERYAANYLGIEGVEIVKNIVDNNSWGALAAGNYEIAYTDSDPAALSLWSPPGRFLRIRSDGFYSYTPTGTSETPFRRKIEVSYPDCPGVENCEDHVRVSSVVSWRTRGEADFTLNVEDHLFNWRQ